MAKRGKKRAVSRVPRITAERVVQGWAGPNGSRLRLARPGEGAAVTELLKEAVELDNDATVLVDAGTAGTTLLAGLDGGADVILEVLAQAACGEGQPEELPVRLTLPLVAESREGRLVGAVLALPSRTLYDLVLKAPLVDERSVHIQALGSMKAVAKIKALAVDESAQGHQIGGALLKRAVQLYHQLGFLLVFGQFAADSGLDSYYARHGFQVLPQGEGTDVGYLLTGTSMMLYAGPGERMFQRWIK